MENKKELIRLLEEKEKRKKILGYKEDFTNFAVDQIKIITKDASQGFINFSFNECQTRITKVLDEQIAKTGKVRAIILKARQQGISTYCAGRVFWKTYYTPYARSVVMAHDSATSDALFNMSKNLIKNMRPELRPKELRSNAKEIIISSPFFPKDEYGERANAAYRLYTAGSPEAGRGTTPTIAHLSEVAFWQHDEKILAGMFQGISQAAGTEVILESTANGAQGEFYRLWKGAERGENEYVPIFLPWFITPEYRRPAPDTFLPTEEEEKLIEDYDLDLDQLYWRRLKIAEGGERKFRQEYPATPDEAFIVSGSNVFDMEKVNKLEAIPPAKKRKFEYDSKMWEDHAEGQLEIYDYPNFDDGYVVGADVALGVGQDYSTAIVLDKNARVLATYRDNYIDPSKFGDLLFYLGRYYNNALMAVESNSMGIATLQQLERMRYVNLYRQTKIANISNEDGERLGFRTTLQSKATVIGNLKSSIEEEDIWVPSATLIQELKDYISTETGRTEAAPGCTDDLVMALAIGLEVLRTHKGRLGTNRVNWSEQWSSFKQEKTNWL